MHAVVVTDMRLFYVRAGPTGGVTRGSGSPPGDEDFPGWTVKNWKTGDFFLNFLGLFKGR